MTRTGRNRNRRRRRGARLGLNLTAMIDVVFLLLVYFMAATEFKSGEEIYRLDLPERGRAADPFELPRDPLRISVTTVGRDEYILRLSGPRSADPGPATFEELFVFLEVRRRSDRAAGGVFEADHPIIVAPTGRTSWEHTMGVFNAAVRARFTNITFAAP